jgi:ABC-type Na+ transport system ATPase subunit NatA
LPEVAQVCEKVVIISTGQVVKEDMLTNLTQGQTLEEVFLKAISQEEPQQKAPTEEDAEVAQ